MQIKNAIPRKMYLDKITPFIGKSLIKVLIGQRVWRFCKVKLLIGFTNFSTFIIPRRKSYKNINPAEITTPEYIRMTTQYPIISLAPNLAIPNKGNAQKG